MEQNYRGMTWRAVKRIGCLAIAVALACPIAGFTQSIQPGITLATCTDATDVSTCTCPASIDTTKQYNTAALNKKIEELQQQLWMQDLTQPPFLSPDPTTNSLIIELNVQFNVWCLPTWTTVTPTDGGQKAQSFWANQPARLRSYGYRTELANMWSPVGWSIPAPTLQLNKASASGKTDGSTLEMTLINELTPYTKDSPVDPSACDPAAGPVKNSPAFTPTSPECFHGANATNMHFHGTHVSPQPPSDYVLLTLLPEGSDPCYTESYFYQSRANQQACETKKIEPILDTAVGRFDYQLYPIPYTQAEGTHWYHPHKHGATALQVQSGMAGALIMKGDFDAKLTEIYTANNGPGLQEKLLVLQQIADDIQWAVPAATAAGAPPILVNGQANPIVTMRPGEIQRWRIVGATQNAAGTLELGFESIDVGCQNQVSDTCPEIRQIAQDGVQFVWKNFEAQPFLGTTTVANETKIATANTGSFLGLAPGNRADFLVKAPTKPGVILLTHRHLRLKAPASKAQVESRNRGLLSLLRTTIPSTRHAGLRQTLQAAGGDIVKIIPETNTPPIVTIVVADCTGPNCATINNMAFPTQSQWPQAPPFLTIASDPSKDIQRSVLFSTTPRATNDQPGQQQGAGTSNISFWLGFGTSPDEVLDPKRPQNQQYCASCSGVSMKLNQPETWMVFNDAAGLSHPLHIHINPFQLLDIGVYDTTAKKTYSYANASQNGPLIQTPVWMDTIALPTAQAANKVTVCGHYITAASTCPDNSTPAKIANATVGYVKMRQTFLDYTGPYVMHCHILGHEDRGMMINLQTLCDDGPAAGTYGQVNADGSSDNCDAFSSNAFLESQMLNNTVKEVPLPVCTPGQCDELVCAPLAKQASQQ